MVIRKFNHLNIPEQWETYWSKYPQGYTILEALIQWVQQVDDMVDNQNDLSDKVTKFREEIDLFIQQFEFGLRVEVTKVLREWQDSGYLEIVISEALQTQITEVDGRLTPLVNKAVTDILKKPDLLTTAITYTVGATGDFKTINEALIFASKVQPTYKYGGMGIGIDIVLQSGFVMKEQVLISSVDMSYVSIKAVDAEVIIDRQFLTDPLGSVDRYAAFSFSDGAISPKIFALFYMNETGAANQRNGFNVRLGAKILLQVGAGCKNAGGRGLHVANGEGYANGGIFAGAKQAGIRVANGGRLWAEGCDVSGSLIGLMLDDGTLGARSTKADNCGTAIRAVRSRLDLTGTTANNCGTILSAEDMADVLMKNVTGRGAKESAINILRGSKVLADNSDFSGCLGVPLRINNSELMARSTDLLPVGDVSMVAYRSIIDVDSSKIKQLLVGQGTNANARNAIVTLTASDFTYRLEGKGNSVIAENTIGTYALAFNVLTARGIVYT